MNWMLVMVLLGTKGTLLHSEPVKSEEGHQRAAAVQEQFIRMPGIHQCVDIGAWVAMKEQNK